MTRSGSPAVSVIMNCFNGETYLREAIDSVYAQTFKDWEIVFWDDNSTDASSTIANGFDSRLRYFRNSVTLPLYAARNRAVEQARGKFLGFLDCDDVWLPRKLESQLPLFHAHSNVGLVYSNVEILPEDGRRFRWYQRAQPSGRLFDQLLRHYHLNLPGVMIARRAFEAAGGFDESLTVSGDTDLFLRVCHDWKAVYLSDVTAVYREHSQSLTQTRPELYVKEGEEVVRKLCALYPDMRTDNATDLVSFTAQRQKAYVFGLWRCGRNVQARSIAWRQLIAARSMFALWVLAFLPARFANALRGNLVHRWWRRLKGR